MCLIKVRSGETKGVVRELTEEKYMRGLLDLTRGHMNDECSEPRSNNFNLLLLNTINKKYMMDIYFSPSLGGYFRNNILLI